MCVQRTIYETTAKKRREFNSNSKIVSTGYYVQQASELRAKIYYILFAQNTNIEYQWWQRQRQRQLEFVKDFSLFSTLTLLSATIKMLFRVSKEHFRVLAA